jgi:hypothetical protein
MIKLKNLLEAKQVGDIYHFTPLANISKILKSQYMIPNDEKQVSATRWADMDTSVFQDLQTKPIARFMFDGNKLSNKFQIRPFSYNPGGTSDDHNDFEKLGEEQIVVDGRNFYFMPYLKRIDIFIQKGNPDLNKTIKLLDQMNILYEIYRGTPKNSIPFTQTKEGDPTKINYIAKPNEIYITDANAKNPIGSFKSYVFSNNPQTYPLNDTTTQLTNYKQYIYRHPLIFKKTWKLSNMFPNYYVAYDSKLGFNSENTAPLYTDSNKHSWNDQYSFGRDFRDKNTKYIISNMIYKTWEELGLRDKVSNEINKISDYLLSATRILDDGLIMLPKIIADKFLIPNEKKSTDNYGKWVTPKTKYDSSGIDTPGNLNM